MREWHRPVHFRSPKTMAATLLAYRVRYAADNAYRIPAGDYLVVRLEDPDYKMRILTGPHSEEVVLGRLETATPQRLLGLFERAVEAAEGQSAHQPVH